MKGPPVNFLHLWTFSQISEIIHGEDSILEAKKKSKEKTSLAIDDTVYRLFKQR